MHCFSILAMFATTIPVAVLAIAHMLLLTTVFDAVFFFESGAPVVPEPSPVVPEVPVVPETVHEPFWPAVIPRPDTPTDPFWPAVIYRHDTSGDYSLVVLVVVVLILLAFANRRSSTLTPTEVRDQELSVSHETDHVFHELAKTKLDLIESTLHMRSFDSTVAILKNQVKMLEAELYNRSVQYNNQPIINIYNDMQKTVAHVSVPAPHAPPAPPAVPRLMAPVPPPMPRRQALPTAQPAAVDKSRMMQELKERIASRWVSANE